MKTGKHFKKSNRQQFQPSNIRSKRRRLPAAGTSTRQPLIEQLENRQLLSATLKTIATYDGSGSNLIADAAGNLFGTTGSGGDNSIYPPGYGTVFEIAAGTQKLNTLAEFNGTNGNHPQGQIAVDHAGNVYGTTEFGGKYGEGSVFEINVGTKTVTTLFSFYGSDGSNPDGLICDAAGNLYGATAENAGDYMSSTTANVGTIYKIAAGTHVFTTLATFDGADGAGPYSSLLLDPAGNLYGTTELGGDLSLDGGKGDGTVFELPAATNTLITLVTFNGNNGDAPSTGLVIDGDGNLFGTTLQGGDLTLDSGRGEGTVFEVFAGSHATTTLAIFEGAKGMNPESLIEDAAGNLFGTTGLGGDLTLNSGLGMGTLFEIPAGTNTVSDIVTFGDKNGAFPQNVFADSQGNLFGITAQGSADFNIVGGGATIFEISGSGYVPPAVMPVIPVSPPTSPSEPTNPVSLATAAYATSSTVIGTSTKLSALGADTSGESGLTYTWTVIQAPAGAKAPVFSLNGTNAAKNATITFQKDGGYHLQCTITDAEGHSITTDLSVTVEQTATRFTGIGEPNIKAGHTFTYHAVVVDQFGHAMRTQSSLRYTLIQGPGRISTTRGGFTAGMETGGGIIKFQFGSLTEELYFLIV